MYNIEIIDEGTIFGDQKLNGYFPNIVKTDDGTFVAAVVTGEDFESPDHTTCLFKSHDKGKTWEPAGPIIDKSTYGYPMPDSIKISYCGGSELIAMGYCFPMKNNEVSISNPKTGGLLPDHVVFLRSHDLGSSWSRPEIIKTSFKNSVEASAPVTVLKNGWYATPITNFPDWDGRMQEAHRGKLLLSKDGGVTWSDDTVTISFPEGDISVYEQRICQLDDGRITVISWNEKMDGSSRLPNHFAISEDNGASFSEALPTGIYGQTASVSSIGKGKVLALHCIRRDTDKPGIYAYIVDLSRRSWDILYEKRIWEPSVPITADPNMSEIFAYLKFGQPSVIREDGNLFMQVNWMIENGQGKAVWRRLSMQGI